jgi:hypothetical protein
VDSSFIHNHPQKIDVTDFAEVLGVRETSIHIMVPMVVVDELDRQKENKTDHIRWRSGHALAVLENRSRQRSVGPSLLLEEDFSAVEHGGIPRGRVTIEIVPDPPEHIPLAINDEEIVQRGWWTVQRQSSGAAVQFPDAAVRTLAYAWMAPAAQAPAQDLCRA